MQTTLVTPQLGEARAPRRVHVWLRLLHTPGGRAGVWELPSGTTRIGREVGPGGIQLAEDARASRHHATLQVSRDGRQVRLSEHPGRNGTFVNRVQASGAGGTPLCDGDLLRVGDSFFLLRLLPERQEDQPIPGMLGDAPAMVALRRALHRVAGDDASVLLRGETGTGKELAAAALHAGSGRAGELVAVNCAAIPAELAESQLFGHTAGAFTGARTQQGFFRAAHRGTLFLDELGELPLSLQPKLLRALESRAVVPVGATSPVPVDARLLTATHRDLERDVVQGAFRRDLYARLSDLVIELPPLRHRREDILLLLRHAGADTAGLTPDVVEALLFHPWSMNVREIYKTATHIRLLGAGAALLERLRATAEMSGAEDPSEEPGDGARAGRRESPPSREELIELMQRHQGVIRRVADDLGLSRRQVGRWLETFDLDPEEFRTGRGL